MITDAFDVIGELTFGRRLGFLDQGCDVEGIIADIEKGLDDNGKAGSPPGLVYSIS